MRRYRARRDGDPQVRARAARHPHLDQRRGGGAAQHGLKGAPSSLALATPRGAEPGHQRSGGPLVPGEGPDREVRRGLQGRPPTDRRSRIRGGKLGQVRGLYRLRVVLGQGRRLHQLRVVLGQGRRLHRLPVLLVKAAGFIGCGSCEARWACAYGSCRSLPDKAGGRSGTQGMELGHCHPLVRGPKVPPSKTPPLLRSPP